MNQSQLVLDQVRAMGLILRDARLARDINPRDLETELRTTYRHLLAIEEGQMRLFYSDSFFCDLFTRYAVQLGFSSEQAQDMRLALHGEGPLVASEPEEVESEPEPKSEPQRDSEPKPELSTAVESSPAPEPN
ncbi:MAG: helix-turn-helix domain-containing protein, partial [Burkholderiaceae bacterium]